MDLQTITSLMLSSDYKDRMKGEYYHLTEAEYYHHPERPFIVSPRNNEINVNQVPQIQGSPYSSEYLNMAFPILKEEEDHFWDNVPLNIDVLITHGPPFGIFDEVIDKYGEKKKLDVLDFSKRLMKLNHVCQFLDIYMNTMEIKKKETSILIVIHFIFMLMEM